MRHGFHERLRDDTWACNFALVDQQWRELDVHSYILDSAGKSVFGVPYIAEHLTGTGLILGHRVRCISPEWLVRFHTGYDVDVKDFQDVSTLSKRFGIALPEDYRCFLKP